MAYKPKSQRSVIRDSQKARLFDNLTNNKNIEDIQALAGLNNGLADDVAILQTDVNSLESDVNTLESDVVNLTNQVNSIVSLTDGDKGDITVSGTGTSWTIDNGAVTDNKIVAVSAPKVIQDVNHLFVTNTEKATWNGKQDALVSGTNIKTINGNTLLGSGDLVISPASGITVGTTPVTSGTDGRVFFQSGGVVQQDAGLFWDNTNKRLYLNQGATPLGVIDVRGQSALATHFILRTRNSADTRNFLVVNGAGDVYNNGAGGVTSNTFYGENVGRSTTGIQNTSFGNQTLLLNTTGQSNTSIGTFAMYSNTTGNNNIGLGVQSLNANSTGSNNIGLGNQSLFTNTASENTAIGNGSLYSNSSATRNTSIGYQSSYLTSTGGQNVGIGAFAMYSNTTGSNNVSIGVQSLNNKGAGSSNIALGFEAGRRISGGGNLTTSNNSLFIGEDTRANADNQTNQIVIGHQAIGTGSNSVTLGNTSITRTNLRGQVVISGFASAPTGVEGAIYYDSTTKKHYGFDGTNWNALY